MSHTSDINKTSAAGLLVAIGIVFGDIGTSPLYAYKAIIDKSQMNEILILGGFSCIFWTLFFQTTLKYVFITLQADNNGEGGIFSLFALVRKRNKWLIAPAIIGGAFLLADGIITPPISVSSAIEGLHLSHELSIAIVIGIIFGIFFIQQFGTEKVGKSFGPIMFVWFSFIGIIGLLALISNPSMLKAINPYYAYQLLFLYPNGFWLLGAVFLCTTGAEALYSDMGHCGRANIRISWIYVKICLLLSYAGQGAWMLNRVGETLNDRNPFYTIVPESLQWFSVLIATMAAIIASQALISGSFTLAGEAMRLGLWPKMKIVYPSDLKGQLYLPGLNWFLLAGCIGVVLYFRESTKMEAAYGLAVTCTMLMTTVLMFEFLRQVRWPLPLIIALVGAFVTIEIVFLASNVQKIMHGGWVTLLVGSLLIGIMYVWHKAGIIRKKFHTFNDLKPYMPLLDELRDDKTIPRYATNLVYLTASETPEKIEQAIIHSIFQKQTKRADIYWFIHVDLVDEPFAMSYKTSTIIPGEVFWITFKLGFRIEPRINVFFRIVVEELVKNGEVNITSRYESLGKHNITGDFRFVVLERFLSYENDLPAIENLVMNTYFAIKNMTISDAQSFGLDTSSITIEKVPMVIKPVTNIYFVREFDNVDKHGKVLNKDKSLPADYVG